MLTITLALLAVHASAQPAAGGVVITPGAACSSNSSCASNACLGGFCELVSADIAPQCARHPPHPKLPHHNRLLQRCRAPRLLRVRAPDGPLQPPLAWAGLRNQHGLQRQRVRGRLLLHAAGGRLNPDAGVVPLLPLPLRPCDQREDGGDVRECPHPLACVYFQRRCLCRGHGESLRHCWHRVPVSDHNGAPNGASYFSGGFLSLATPPLPAGNAPRSMTAWAQCTNSGQDASMFQWGSAGNQQFNGRCSFLYSADSYLGLAFIGGYNDLVTGIVFV